MSLDHNVPDYGTPEDTANTDAWVSQVSRPTPAPTQSPMAPAPAPVTLAPTALPNVATPMPPAAYMPVGAELLDKPIVGLGPFGAGARLNLQRSALAAQKEQMDIATGWQNFQRSKLFIENWTKKQSIAMDEQGMETVSNARAALSSLPQAAVEERQHLTEHYDRLIGGMSPTASKVWDDYKKNPALHYNMNSLVAKSPELQILVESVGYPKLLAMPEYRQQAAIDAKDKLHSIVGRFEVKDILSLKAGKMGQEKFASLIDQYALDPTGKPISPADHQMLKEWISSPEAVPYMEGLGVHTDVTAAKRAMTRAGQSSMRAGADDRYDELKVKQGDGTATPAELHDIDVYEKQSAMDSSGQQKSTTPADHELVNGLADSQYGQGILNYTQLGQAIAQYRQDGNLPAAQELEMAGKAAQARAYKGYASGRVEAGLDAPVDLSKKDVYEVAGLGQGKLTNVKTPLTDRELRSGNYVQLEKSEKGKLQQMAQSVAQGHELFHTANKLFKAKDSWDVTKQSAIATDIKYFGWAGAAARHDPDWQVYLTGLKAWASTDARTLGTEVGVMTNTDIDRWVATFPNETDTAESAKKKIALFDKMVSYVMDTNVKILAGTLDLKTDQKAIQKNRDTIEGFLGNGEQHSKANNPKPTTLTTPKPMTAGQRLLEKMGAQ